MTRRLVRWCLQRYLTPARERQWLIDIYFSRGDVERLMTRLWNDRVKGVFPGQHPNTILLGRPLYDQYLSGLTCLTRYVERSPVGLRPKALVFKSARVFPFGAGHTVEFI